MKDTIFPFEAPYDKGARSVTWEQARALGITDEVIAKGELRGKLKTRGLWHLPVSYSAIACWQDFSGEYHEYASRPVTFFGKRTLSKVRQSGYALEGRVKLNGKSYRGFTSSTLLVLPDGKLISVAVIHVCK